MSGEPNLKQELCQWVLVRYDEGCRGLLSVGVGVFVNRTDKAWSVIVSFRHFDEIVSGVERKTNKSDGLPLSSEK